VSGTNVLVKANAVLTAHDANCCASLRFFTTASALLVFNFTRAKAGVDAAMEFNRYHVVAFLPCFA